MRILIIEDTAAVAKSLGRILGARGYDTRISADGMSGLAAAEAWEPDVVILDLGLPDISGYMVLRRLRERGEDPAVLVLSGVSDAESKARAFELGADQYVAKPFAFPELLARVARLCVRARIGGGGACERIAFGEVELDLAARTVHRQGVPIALRPREFDLLLALIRNRGRVVSRQQLLKEVWACPAAVQTRTVDEHIKELRQKIEQDRGQPRHILTARKLGYRFESRDLTVF